MSAYGEALPHTPVRGICAMSGSSLLSDNTTFSPGGAATQPTGRRCDRFTAVGRVVRVGNEPDRRRAP